MRARIIAHFAPYFRDVAIAGIDRDEMAVLAFPDLDACRALVARGREVMDARGIVSDPLVQREMRRLLAALAAGATGSSTRVARLILLEAPPSLDADEITDKGSINQRAVLARRADIVEELYATPCSSRVITLARA